MELTAVILDDESDMPHRKSLLQPDARVRAKLSVMRLSRFVRVQFVLVLSIAGAGCAKQSTPATPAPTTATAPAEPPVTNKDPEAARKLIASGAVVIDVRRPDEFATGHVPNATNIPVEELGGRLTEVEQLSGGDKTRPIVVYCARGQRAGKAKEQLEAAGYSNIVNGGGFDELRD
jgi:rhodanese-related sulfurtransferase